MDHCAGKTENFHSHLFMYRKNDYLRIDMTGLGRNLRNRPRLQSVKIRKQAVERLLEFVQNNIQADTSRLLLDRHKWPDIDIDTAVNCIESRIKLKNKVREWYDNPHLIFPLKLSAEQCSSSLTGLYKADLAERIAGAEGWKLADLTGGLGVDSWFFSKKASQVLYCEMQKALCDAARHNFTALMTGNIQVCNYMVAPESEVHPETVDCISPESLLEGFRPDIIYLDPARRGEGGKKVFLLEDCTPDILTLKDSLFKCSRNILLKLSPMADITMVCERLGACCREVHIVGAGGECKELLVWMDRDWNGEYEITAAELTSSEDGSEDSGRGYIAHTFTFRPSEEKSAVAQIAGKEEISAASYLFEPGKAMMKAGGYNMLCARFGLKKIGRSTHYYIPKQVSGNEKNDCPGPEFQETMIAGLGKTFRILECSTLDKRSIKRIAAEYPKAEVTARNLPMDTDTLRKKLGTSSSDTYHIFGLKSDTAGNILITTSRH